MGLGLASEGMIYERSGHENGADAQELKAYLSRTAENEPYRDHGLTDRSAAHHQVSRIAESEASASPHDGREGSMYLPSARHAHPIIRRSAVCCERIRAAQEYLDATLRFSMSGYDERKLTIH